MNRNKKTYRKGKTEQTVKREQPKKDSRGKRINLDNERVDKIKDISCTKASNDVRWYAKSPELLRSAASLPFSTVTGLPITEFTGISSGDKVYYNAVPGVMVLNYRYSLGGSFIDAINAAANSIYSFVVHANSRNTSYEAGDLMLMILAGAATFAAIAKGIRAYGIMKQFDQRNAYLPKALIYAMGFDYDDLQANLSQMWFDINEMIARTAQIWIPNTLPFIERWFWLESNVYTDGDSAKAQYYIFNTPGTCGYTEGSSFGTSLDMVNMYPNTTDNPNAYSMYPGDNRTWATYLASVNGLMNRLINSEDRGVIFGDILKAYGKENIYALNEIPADYRVVPVYDKEVLTQIENAAICSTIPTRFMQWNGRIYEEYNDTKNVKPTTSTVMVDNDLYTPSAQVLNFHQMEIPTPEQIMVATRLKPAGNILNPKFYSAQKTAAVSVPSTSGTEVVVRISAIYISRAEGEDSVINALRLNQVMSTASLFNFQVWSAFDWCPWLYTSAFTIPTGDNASLKAAPQRAFGDWDQWTIIDEATLKKMNQTAIYSEFGVPVL